MLGYFLLPQTGYDRTSFDLKLLYLTKYLYVMIWFLAKNFDDNMMQVVNSNNSIEVVSQ